MLRQPPHTITTMGTPRRLTLPFAHGCIALLVTACVSTPQPEKPPPFLQSPAATKVLAAIKEHGESSGVDCLSNEQRAEYERRAQQLTKDLFATLKFATTAQKDGSADAANDAGSQTLSPGRLKQALVTLHMEKMAEHMRAQVALRREFPPCPAPIPSSGPAMPSGTAR